MPFLRSVYNTPKLVTNKDRSPTKPENNPGAIAVRELVSKSLRIEIRYYFVGKVVKLTNNCARKLSPAKMPGVNDVSDDDAMYLNCRNNVC